MRPRLLALAAVLLLAACQTAPHGGGLATASLDYRESGARQADARRAGIVVDAASGEVLHADNPDAPRYPASMTKMMTLYVLLEEMESGRMRPDTPLTVSAFAAARPPSKLGIRPGATISARDAMGVMAVKSANDVAVVIAENISGSEAAFAERMTRTARAVGMRSTRFRNASGLPDPEQVTTARDMAVLLGAIQQRFPSRSAVLGMQTYAYAGRTYRNTNQLLSEIPGMDAGKTGYTQASGYNLATSVRRNGRRINVVVMGEPSGSARSAEVTALVAEYLPERSGWLALR